MSFIKELRSLSAPCLQICKKGKLQFPFLCRLGNSLEEILSYYDELGRIRQSLPFEVDGAVIKVESFEEQARAGETARHPRWAVAGKFEPALARTQIEDIALQVGRTGVVTPVALMTPVSLGGVTVRQAGLHNFKELSRKDVRPGDTVEVWRAGDVIPEVIRVLKEERGEESRPFTPPEGCPVCRSLLQTDGDYLRCCNPLCPAIRERALIYFASRSCMNIEFLGEKSIQKFYKKGWLNSFSSFYELPEKPLEKEEGFGERSRNLLVKSLNKSKKTTLARLLSAIGIPGVGEQTARRLSRAVREKGGAQINLKEAVEVLMSLKEEELTEIPDIGEVSARAVQAVFRREDLIQDLKKLHDLGVRLSEQKEEGPLAGKSFVITGKLPRPRSEVKALIELRGGEVLSSVSRKNGLSCLR